MPVRVHVGDDREFWRAVWVNLQVTQRLAVPVHPAPLEWSY